MLRKFLTFSLEKGKNILILALLLPFLFSNHEPAKAEKAPEVPTQVMQVEAKPLDSRAVILRDYLAKYDSPLQDNAQDFIDAADTYHVDWKLVPAISGVESTFGKVTPGGYNGWGWGVYGNQAMYFGSWRDGIFTVTKGLRENYIDKGLINPYQMNYVYAESPFWGGRVTFFMNDLDQFAKTYNTNNQLSVALANPVSAATPSAQIAQSKPLPSPLEQVLALKL